MTPEEKPSDLSLVLDALPGPVLIVSTVVGRGMYSLGQALEERLRERRGPDARIHHVPIEELVPRQVVNEDLRRYHWISNHAPVLLNLVYRVPIFYYRKYLRERWLNLADPSRLAEEVARVGARSVLCVSHRPCFWVSNYKRRTGAQVQVWGLLGEYGHNLGWRYQFWDQIDGFLSPVPRSALRFRIPASVRFERIELPARREYEGLARTPGDPDRALLVCGYWGQGPINRTLRELLEGSPRLRVTAVFGENRAALERARAEWGANPRIELLGEVPRLAPLIAACGSIVTKPGIATIVESHAAGRKIFLLRGMPVAEDNNARHAVRELGADWFTPEAFARWHGQHER